MMREKIGIKKIFAILFSFALVLQMGLISFPQAVSAAEEETVTFDVKYSAAELQRGEEITITVNMPGNNGQALDAELQYDSEKLEFISKEQVDGLNGENGDPAFVDTTPLTGKVKLVAVLADVDTHFKGGEILKLTFKVKDTAAAGAVGLKFVVNDIVYESRTNVGGQLESHSITGIVPEKADAVVVDKPDTDQPGTDKPDTDKPDTNEPDTDKPETDTDQPDADKPAEDNPITEVIFESESLEILKGQTADISALLKITPNDTTDDKTVVWSSSDETVAAVDTNGVITTKNTGAAIITAKVGSFSAELKVTVTDIPLVGIAFDKVIDTMEVGETETLHIIYNPENTTDDKTVEWNSSDSTVIKVDNGTLTALKAGKATITAVSNGKEVSCVITVNDKPEMDDPETGKPDTDKPETDAPETGKPDTDKPETGKPDTDTPEMDGPDTDKPEADAPGTDKPEEDSPKTGDNVLKEVYLVLSVGLLGTVFILWGYKRRSMYR